MSDVEPNASTAIALSCFQNVNMPSNLRLHPLIAGRFFYSLPTALLREIERSFQKHERFSSDDWKMEYQLSRLTERVPNSVGFFDGVYLEFNYLRSRAFNAAFEQLVRERYGAVAADKMLADMSEQLDKLNANYQAYLGWLLTNNAFLTEHRQLWEGLGPTYLKYSIPTVIVGTAGDFGCKQDLPANEQALFKEGQDAISEFGNRWRLQGIAGPFLPLPLSLQVPALPIPLAQHYAAQLGMKSIVVPDILTADEGQLRNWMENSTAPDDAHLREWHAFVSPSNCTKQSMQRFQRQFQVQHYFRVLARRHPQLLLRNQAKLEYGFGEFLGVSEDAIKKDLAVIRGRLGPDWTAIDPHF